MRLGVAFWWEELSCCFPLMGRAEVMSADDCVCIFFLFVVWMRHLTQGATGRLVMLCLVCKWLPLWEFSLFDIP